MEDKQRIAMVGVGMMGHGIATNIIRHGWSLSYLHHEGNQPTGDLDAAGARRFTTVPDLAAESDLMVLCVSGSPQVEDILEGSGRLLDSLRPEMVIIDCSTADPSSTVRLASAVEAKGAHFVDAAMTRTPKEAAEGRLNLLVGGADQTVEKILPLLRSFSENIFRAGKVGTGHQLKLLHNFVSLGSVTLIAEAAACASKGGVSLHALVDCLGQGGGGGVALERLRPFILENETAQLRFTISNAAKDLRYYRQLAADLGAADKVAEGVSQTLEGLVNAGNGMAFMPEAARLIGE